MTAPVGVYLSATHDLADLYADPFARVAPDLDIRRPTAIDDPAAVRFAIAWQPSADAFRPYPRLALVASIAAGVNHILACPSLPDVPVVRIRDPEQAQMMAGFVAANVLWWGRRFAEQQANATVGVWARLPVRPPSAVGVGILGYGLMGQATARTLRTLGYRVRAFARTAGRDGVVDGVEVETGPGGLRRLAASSDVLVNLLPLTDQTRGILSADLFDRLPDGAILIQVGRGEHLDEAALLAALDHGRLGGASLDVFAREPLPPDHPFWSHPKILVSPHVAAESSHDTVARSIAGQVRRVVAGDLPLDPVPRHRGY